MSAPERLRADLEAAMAGPGVGLAVADRLCRACVEILHVDGAAISLVHHSSSQGTFGSSGDLSRQLDEFQFTFGEGPCLDAVSGGRPVLVADLEDEDEHRWPVFSAAVQDAGIRGVFALPVAVAATCIGVLDLFRHAPGPLSVESLAGGLLAAELAALPLMDILAQEAGAVAGDRTGGSSQLAELQRVEVYQATGMIMEQLDVGPTEALIRLRAHAFAMGQTASEVAWAIVGRRLHLESDEAWRRPGGGG